MLSLFEQLNSIGKTNFDAALKFASASSELTERLIKARVDAAAQLLDGYKEQLKALLSKSGNVASVLVWRSVYQANMENAQEISRGYFAEVSKIQTDMHCLMMEQVAAINKGAVKNFGALAKANLEEGEKVVKAAENSAKGKRAA